MASGLVRLRVEEPRAVGEVQCQQKKQGLVGYCGVLLFCGGGDDTVLS